MKDLATYQYIGGEMTERDKLEVGSKFWNEGKWNNFIEPLLPKDCKEMTFVDVGCNRGLFLKLAKERGFERVIGVEPDPGAYKQALRGYEIINDRVENVVDKLPVADVTLLANVHYYIRLEDWREYLKKVKTNYFIIITTRRRPNFKYAAPDIESIRNDFAGWKEIGMISIPKDSTPHSRELYGICFKRPGVERVPIDTLDNGNAQQIGFLEEIDRGVDPLQTTYYRRLRSYRKRTGSKQEIWSKERLINYMHERVELYEDVKKNGLKEALIVRKDNRITDGNHRCEIRKHLGHKTILIKYEGSNNLHK